MLRFLTAGESHGKAEVAILEGIPSDLPISNEEIQKELDKRREGAGRGGRSKIESDKVSILSGVRFGKTLGGPICLYVPNLDHEHYSKTMSPEDIFKEEKEKIRLTKPRPGHADLAGTLKYGFDDIRNILERASARETIMRVAVGAICKQFLKFFEIKIASHTIQIGKIKIKQKAVSFDNVYQVYLNDPEIRCIDKQKSIQMKKAINEAIKEKSTLGGVVEIIAINVPPGLGSHVHWDRKLDSRLSQILMSIPSVKAVEIGEGIINAGLKGSMVHDEIFHNGLKFFRETNNSGGIEGGISNGENITAKIFLKPISTLGSPLNTVDIISKISQKAIIERSDICVVPRAGVVGESSMAFVLADLFIEKFGGDNIKHTLNNFLYYKNNL